MERETQISGVALRRFAHLYRPEAEFCKNMPYMVVAYVIFAAALVWVYDQGKQSKPYLKQGLRFGAAIAALTIIPTTLIYYTIQPLPCELALKQIAFGTVESLIVGVLVAFLRKA